MRNEPELLAEGLGWAEGPAVLPDGRVCFVETYRSQVSAVKVCLDIHTLQVVQTVVLSEPPGQCMSAKMEEQLAHGGQRKWSRHLFR
jgi:hypothetical protein